MKKFTFFLSICLFFAGNAIAQDRNNDDGVITLNAQTSRYNSVPNEVLVKFRDNAVPVGAGRALPLQRSAPLLQRTAPNRVSSTISAVDAVLSQYELEEAEQLLPNDNPQRVMRRSRSFSGNDVVETSLNQLYKLRVSAASPKTSFELIEELKALPEVEFAEPNYIVSVLHPTPALPEGEGAAHPANSAQIGNTPHSLPFGEGRGGVNAPQSTTFYANDPLFYQQWGFAATNLNWLLDQPVIHSARPKIAILDTGVDIAHPDLAANIWTNAGEQGGAANYDNDGNGFKNDIHGWDFVNNTAAMHDFNGHGTHCAGIAAAVGNNGIGITGANPNALIMPITVMQSNGTGDIATIIKGINYAKNNGADIISMSLGTYAYSIALEQALAQAYQTCILVGAAGNDGICIYPKCFGAPMFPASFTFVLGVQAAQDGGGRASFSNYDPDGPVFSDYSEEQLYNYELLAPGAGIYSTMPNGQYRALNGTSMATPLVAGAISALKQRKDFASQEELWANLIQSANGSVSDFQAAYSFVPQPQLNIISIEINDTLNGDGDMRADAGELLQIFPTLKNTGGITGGENDTIYYKLEFAEFEDTNTGTILNNDTKFGYALSAYSKMKAANPINLQINPDVVDGRVIKFVFTTWHGNHLGEVSQNLEIYVENGVELSGMLMHNDTLYPNVHYIVTNNFAIPAGVTLVIKPGTVIKLKNTSISNAGTIEAIGMPDSLITFIDNIDDGTGLIYLSQGNYEYCIFDGINLHLQNGYNLSNCIIKNSPSPHNFGLLTGSISKTNIINNAIWYVSIRNSVVPYDYNINLYNNFANNIVNSNDALISFNEYNDGYQVSGYRFGNSNLLPNSNNNGYIVKSGSPTPQINSTIYPCWWGSSVESIARKGIFDFYTPQSGVFGAFDLSNMLTQPVSEAHGIVWKVVVNGYDAQDEFDALPPLGVGSHEFKVYFNRAMDTLVTPMVAMGVRPPYTQNAIAENGSWSADSTIYTAHLTIKGASSTDGLNRIYVANARDNEHFEIPYENQRFNVVVQAAGSLSAGFAATAGMGKVDLEWESPEDNIDDVLGYNMYRYTFDTEGISSDTARINENLLTEVEYTDFDVTPGQTYNYMYKVMRTDLSENDYSRVVSSVPYTAAKGDANGSLTIDVVDIVATVSHITGGNPQPFIFDAADVNSDGIVNVLDIVGIVNLILNPQPSPSPMRISSTAAYSIEHDTLFVESPVNLGGVQFKIKADRETADIRALAALNGMENVSQWQNDTTFLLLAFSMSGNEIPAGRNALVKLGAGATLQEIVLADSEGASVIAVPQSPTDVPVVLSEIKHQMTVSPNPFRDELRIRLASGYENAKVDLIFSDLLGREINRISATQQNGVREYIWLPSGTGSGIYFCTLRINGQIKETAKVILVK